MAVQSGGVKNVAVQVYSTRVKHLYMYVRRTHKDIIIPSY